MSIDAAPSSRGARSRWEIATAVAIVLLAFAAFGDGARRWWPRTVDDAFIVFCYAANVVEGRGPTYNPGERVEGHSSPMWVALHAAGLAAGLDAVVLSKMLGLVSSLALLATLWLVLRRAHAGWLAASIAVGLVGTSVVFQIWSVSGLETNLFAALLFAGLAALAAGEATPRTHAAASSWLTAAALTRPEGILSWLFGLSFVAATNRGRRLRPLVWFAVPVLAWCAYLAWRFAYYGEWLPNTYYAKTGGGTGQWLQGLRGLTRFSSSLAHGPWLAAAVIGAVVGARRGTRGAGRGVALMAGAVLLHLTYIVSVGDDGLTIHRFYVPILAPLAWLAVSPLVNGQRGARVWLVPLAATVLAAVGSLTMLHRDLLPSLRSTTLVYQEGNEKLGRHLARTREPDTLIAVAAAGAIPYYSRLPAIDMYGLNDPVIARRPFPEARRGRFMKWDVDYVLEREPDLIVINRGYFRAGDPRALAALRDPGQLVFADLDRALFARLARRDVPYALVPLRLDDGSTFFVFERR